MTGATACVICIGYLAHITQSTQELLQDTTIPTPEDLPLTSEVFDRHGMKIGEIASERRYFVSIKDIPQHVQDAFLSAEDKNFYSHSGISVSAILRSALANIKGRSIKQGASTITQQLARIYYLNQKKTFDRKLREAVLALMLEKKLTKSRILELYLNKIYLGNHSYGIEAAARNYFRKPTNKLTISEAAMLAGLPPSPSRYAPHQHLKEAKLRQHFVLKRMVEDGYLNPSDLTHHLSTSLTIAEEHESFPHEFGFIVNDVARYISKKFELNHLPKEGLKIHTTIDHDLQLYLAQSLAPSLDLAFKETTDIEGGILAVSATTGQILAMQGGKDFGRSQFNRTRKISRPTGDLLLPILSALRLSQDANLMTPILSDDGYDLTVLDLLTTPTPELAAAIYESIGNQTFKLFSKSIGLYLSRYDIGAAFGLAKSNPLAIAQAYQTLASNGQGIPLYLVHQINNSFGESRYSAKYQAKTRFISEKAAYSVMYALTTFSPKNNVFVTSGTDLRDAWAVSFTDNLLLIAWAGSDSGISRLGFNTEDVENRMNSLITKIKQGLPIPADLASPTPPSGINFYRTALPNLDSKKVSIPF